MSKIGFVTRVMLLVISAYQRWISPLLGPHCRFHPTCSSYAAESLRAHGLVRGLVLAIARIARCHPWHPGGLDPVPASRRVEGTR